MKFCVRFYFENKKEQCSINKHRKMVGSLIVLWGVRIFIAHHCFRACSSFFGQDGGRTAEREVGNFYIHREKE